MVGRMSIKVDQMPDVRVSLQADKMQIGRVLAQLGKSIGKTWVPVGGEIVFKAKPTDEDEARKKQLIRLAIGQ